MATFERSVHVDAPFESVWAFHSRVSGLVALTPDWMDLRVEAIYGPDGERLDTGQRGADAGHGRDPTDSPSDSVLEAGSTIHLSVAPGGLGPRQRWTSQIVAREEHAGAAYFRDEMVAGPFPEWTHTHLFYRDGDGTLARDVVQYELPGGGIGHRFGPLATIGFEPMFAYRHRRTKRILE